ncbi:transportin-1-like [Triticum urartu]|uniref:transportin-1-like n=1 Tax=Triticum urartu TaxID=4572 RepID=UPI0020433F18|nr:transportin-1-like [Triticum urartu]
MKSELSRCVGTCYKAIRSTVTTIIAALFRWVRVAGWMDLFQELYECICCADPDRNETALEVFCKISENDAQHLNVDIIGLPERPICVFMPVLVQFLRSPDATFRKLALGCVRQYMVMPNTPSLHYYMDEYFEHLLDLFKDPSLDVRKQLVEHLPSTLEKKLAKMDDEGWNDNESAFSSFGAIAEVFALLILHIDEKFPLIRSTIRHIIVLCSKFTIQGLGHADGGEQFVLVLIGLLGKTLDVDENVQELAVYALEALEEEMEIQKGAEDEAILACQYYIQEHGAEGWEKLMSILDPAIVRRLQRLRWGEAEVEGRWRRPGHSCVRRLQNEPFSRPPQTLLLTSQWLRRPAQLFRSTY